MFLNFISGEHFAVRKTFEKSPWGVEDQGLYIFD
jgi:hypothetical protein